MTKFCTLVSGSSGNAVFLSYNGTNILIDCGISGKQVAAYLETIGICPSEIDSILVTHEHIDHTKGVGILSRRFDIPVVASVGTWQGMEIGNIADKNRIMFSSNNQMDISGIGVTPFDIPHDALQPTGYRFDIGGKSVAVATDMGHITPNIKNNLKGCEVVILESNYDEMMLENGPYPFYLKKRIGGSNGHLCNDDAGILASYLVQNGTKYVMLGHLSNENNSPETAFASVAKEMEFNNIKIGADVLLSVAPRYETSVNIGMELKKCI